MPDAPRSSRRTRPLPRELTAALTGEVPELGRAWLVALIERASLERVGALPLGSFVAVAPRIGEGAVAALGDDDALASLSGGEGAALGAEIADACGAHGAPELSEALDALRDVLWDRALAGLGRPAASEVVELAERLSQVIDALRSAALAGAGTGFSPPASQPFPVRPPNSAGAEEKARLAARLRSVSATTAGSAWRARSPVPPGGPVAGRHAHAEPSEHREPAPPVVAPEAVPDWTEALEQELERAREEHRRLALLLVELDDAERLIAAAGEDAEATVSRFAATVRGALRQGDVLALDGDGRAWVIARDSGRVAGRALARRISRAVDQAGELSGEPLQASAGVAVLGEDGDEAEALIDAAEQERFAAAARGLTLLDS